MENKTNTAHIDQRFVLGLINGDSKLIEEIYTTYFKFVDSFVRKNKGTTNDAKDLFNDSLKIIYLQGKDNNLILRSSFGGYLQTICKRRWINELKRRQKFTPDIEDQLEPVSEENIGETMEDQEKMLLYRKHFSNLPGRCREILDLSHAGFNLREIAEQLELNYNYVRKRIGLCVKGLMETIKDDPVFKELI